MRSAGRSKTSEEEWRRLFVENQWALVAFVLVYLVALVVSFEVLSLGDSALVRAVVAVGLVLTVGMAFGWWRAGKVRAMRAESPPSIGGRQGGERPGG